MNITYIPQDAPLGLAHAVKISQDFLGDDRFVMYLGDNAIEEDISGLIRQFADSAWNSQIVLTQSSTPILRRSRVGRGGAHPQAGRKATHPQSNLALAGFNVLISMSSKP